MGIKEQANIIRISKIITSISTNNQVRMLVISEGPLPMLKLNNLATILNIRNIMAMIEVDTKEEAAEETEETEEAIKEVMVEDNRMVILIIMATLIHNRHLNTLKHQQSRFISKIYKFKTWQIL